MSRAQELFVAGVWSYDGKKVKGLDLPVGLELQLRREPHNPHDPNATAVHLTRDALLAASITPPDDAESYKLGFIPANVTAHNWAKSVAAALDAGEDVRCVFVRRGKGAEMCMRIEGDVVDRAHREMHLA